MSAAEQLETAVELLRLHRRHQDVSRRREQLQERVGHYPNDVNTGQLKRLVAEERAVALQIAQLEAI